MRNPEQIKTAQSRAGSGGYLFRSRCEFFGVRRMKLPPKPFHSFGLPDQPYRSLTNKLLDSLALLWDGGLVIGKIVTAFHEEHGPIPVVLVAQVESAATA
jgi:hypothetical protein